MRKRKKNKNIFKQLNSPRNRHTFAVAMLSIMMLVGIFTMFFSVYLYMVQFHNLDLSYNVALMTNDVNHALKEKNVSLDNLNYRLFNDAYDIGKSAPYTTFYVLSANSFVTVIMMAISGAFMFSMGLFWNINLHDQFNRKLK